MNPQKKFFPVTLSSQWFSPQDASNNASSKTLSSSIIDWLLDTGSLTARLKMHCQNFRVELLGQQVQPCPESEANDLIMPGEDVLVREVILYCDEVPQVFARSFLPLSSLTGAEQQLANLGTQSLGQVLFNNPSLKRRQIEIAHFDENSSVATLSKALNLPFNESIWGRRSTFILEDKPLMVAEVFLPNAFAYCSDNIETKHVQ